VSDFIQKDDYSKVTFKNDYKTLTRICQKINFEFIVFWLTKKKLPKDFTCKSFIAKLNAN